ncbi:hypothetical protein [Acanthamoeba castellanii mimivirus]|uniref:Uncharacterized protein R83 n=5 Tax=Mimivirus TaxID=315393 RepID=YR083_MIMIV|nr:hypothetical protein MIMI_gp0100 [Acanthamoeba polyphaga mimivirus]Q5UPG3.1 RecName: Full=Uncharacterized protein R83 [Acanthamoeba polyphaga mimivirus]AEQ60263.1 hypothetical protein [Acanthamoeba castellanii mamavirus]AHA45793.1 hypothetical protein HIRU_S887 [Hirudovirus strain Sangsue]AHJ39889.1 hypothetical protein [Samba virus]ALR83596.1 hypothetical protein [Niemeyer virus]AMZ02533.1 hypothetical protein [Mimivirus Bombay]EJN41163.1 hypothetical protein lvs_R52 [Acanthamoeba polyph
MSTVKFTVVEPTIFSNVSISFKEDKIILFLESKVIGTLYQTSGNILWESECPITRSSYKELSHWMKCYDCGRDFCVPKNCDYHDQIPKSIYRESVLNKYTLTIKWTNYCSLESAITKTIQVYIDLNKIETNTN